MGAMPCTRNNCHQVMCDIYIDDIGYICPDCKQEFKKRFDDKFDKGDEKPRAMKQDILKELKTFLKSRREFNNPDLLKNMTFEEFFDEIEVE